MQLNDQLKLVKYKLENINELHNKLAEQGRLSTIELDLLLRNMMEVYEFYHIVKMEKVLWQQSDPAAYEHKDDLVAQEEHPVAQETIEEEEEEVETAFTADMDDEPEPEVSSGEEEELPEELDTDISAEEAAEVEPEVVTETVVTERITVSTMSLFEEDTPEDVANEPVQNEEEEIRTFGTTVYPDDIQPQASEQVSPAEPEVSTVTQVETPPVSRGAANKPALPIETHIAINDKFVFIRELFGGDFDTYEQTIYEINNLDSRSEALEYLATQVADKFSWHEKEETANDFYALLQKHFDF